MRFPRISRRRRIATARGRKRAAAVTLTAVAALAAIVVVDAGPSAAGSRSQNVATRASATNDRQHASARDGLGIQPGKIRHVWLIILENKSYDATFTGLNNNSYLWKTLPSQGALLKNYYGTGH